MNAHGERKSRLDIPSVVGVLRIEKLSKNSSPQLGLLTFEKSLYIVKIVKNKLLGKSFFM